MTCSSTQFPPACRYTVLKRNLEKRVSLRYEIREYFDLICRRICFSLGSSLGLGRCIRILLLPDLGNNFASTPNENGIEGKDKQILVNAYIA